jgi:predicted PurR-regulated permease PerM
MAKLFDADTTLKRLRNRYRLVVMNDDTYEEVVTFKLSRLSVYITLSTIFVLLVGLTVALISFTNLKYYLPGYGTQSQRKELMLYKTRIDSLERGSLQKDLYLESLKKVLSGNVNTVIDTVPLKIPEVEKSTH